MAPLLRYNDAARRIADSVVFRLGTQGRPIALMTSELYGNSGRTFVLNHEFLAVDNPRVRVNRDEFVWIPPKGTEVGFQPLQDEPSPADTERGRLAQLKKISSRFTAREPWRGTQFALRILPTPIDRYVPSKNANADGAIFTFVQGVNPEAVLLLETDGKGWTFGWARLGQAKITRSRTRTVGRSGKCHQGAVARRMKLRPDILRSNATSRFPSNWKLTTNPIPASRGIP